MNFTNELQYKTIDLNCLGSEVVWFSGFLNDLLRELGWNQAKATKLS